jgi:Zinc carboxypeptidase
MPYLTAATIESRLASLATTYPSLCTRLTFPNLTHDRRQVSYINSAMVPIGSRPAVLITGGVHAREWVPPDAVLSFAEKLFRAYNTRRAISYPVFRDTADRINYKAFSIPWGDVKKIVERLDLYIAPLVNPDGRVFSQSFLPANVDWRKNRRPPTPPDTEFGVDINRNFDIAWDFDLYYDATTANKINNSGFVSRSNTSSDTYHGPSSASEPEAKNVQWLVANQGIKFFLDVHSYGRTILYPWSIEDNQSREQLKNFTNPTWNTRRDGVGGTYGEYFPNDLVNPRGLLLDQHKLLANRMKDSIVKTASADPRFISRSTYKVEQSLLLYPTPITGVADDYIFSRQFLTNPASTVFAYTLECGSDINGEGGFKPDDFTNKYPKIEREVHAAIWGFLSYAASTIVPVILMGLSLVELMASIGILLQIPFVFASLL